MGLRSMVQTADCPVAVSQRLERLTRIVRKLSRIEGMNLARLEDIGGCRAVLPTAADLERVKGRLVDRWSRPEATTRIVRQRPYTVTPQVMGYRAHHIIVERAGRRIEIQLRTAGQQEWANAVEASYFLTEARLSPPERDTWKTSVASSRSTARSDLRQTGHSGISAVPADASSTSGLCPGPTNLRR